MNSEKTIYEYGAMSSKFSCEAENKLVAYATMCLHYQNSPHLVAIYSPEESKKDSWMSFDGKISERLDEIFIENSKLNFDDFVGANIDSVKECYKSIKRLV